MKWNKILQYTLKLFGNFHLMLLSLIFVDILFHYLEVTKVKQETWLNIFCTDFEPSAL